MLALPSPDDLQCFVEIARLSSFSGAARALALTPSAVSQRIKNLEAMIGRPLFERTTRSVALTPSGRALLPRAHATLDAAKDAVRAGRGETGHPPLDLVVGTRYELGLSWVVPMLSELNESLPWLTVHLYFGSGSDLLIRVRSLEIDVAISSTRLTDPKLDSRILHDEAYVFVASPSLLSKTPLRRVADTRRHVLLDTTEALPLFRYLRDAPGGVGDLRFLATRRLGTIAAISALVIASEGVAVLPEYYVRDDLRARRLRRVLPKAPIASDRFRLVFRSDDGRVPYYEMLAKEMCKRPLQ
jgi:DNA-binding transcriptional LysR family regulator